MFWKKNQKSSSETSSVNSSEAISGKLVPQDPNDEPAEEQIRAIIENRFDSYKSEVLERCT